MIAIAKTNGPAPTNRIDLFNLSFKAQRSFARELEVGVESISHPPSNQLKPAMGIGE